MVGESKKHEGGVSYHIPGSECFEKRVLKRHAGVFSLWALGVGAVISGDFSGWNLGFAVGGWGGMFIGTVLIAIMYLGLTYSIAEMSPALPHTGGAYSFARTAFGPWGGFITGICGKHRVCAHAGGRGLFHRHLHDGHHWHPRRLAADLVAHRLPDLCRAERARCRSFLRGNGHRHAHCPGDPGVLSALAPGQFDSPRML
nr:hypothetical protein [Mesorhizobium amorphae]